MLVDAGLSIISKTASITGIKNLGEAVNEVRNKQYGRAFKNLTEAGLRMSLTAGAVVLTINAITGPRLHQETKPETNLDIASRFCSTFVYENNLTSHDCIKKVFEFPKESFERFMSLSSYGARLLAQNTRKYCHTQITSVSTKDDFFACSTNMLTKNHELLFRLI